MCMQGYPLSQDTVYYSFSSKGPVPWIMAHPHHKMDRHGGLNPVLCDNLEGEGEEGGLGGSGHMSTCGWLMLMYGTNHTVICKAIILQ